MSILTDKKVMMNRDDMSLVREAVKNIYEKDISALPALEGWDVLLHFDKALGINLGQGYRDRTEHQDEPMPDEWVEFLKKLCSPHGKTILKMYQAKRGLTKCQF